MIPPYNNYNNNGPYYPIQQYTFVDGIEGAKAYPIMPNQSMLLMDAKNQICYKKTADALGNCNIRYFVLDEVDEAKIIELTKPQPTGEPMYASKEDINKLNQRLDELLKKLDKPVRKETKENV